MEKTNFKFMKSGFNNLQEKPELDNLETSQILAVMTVYIENAIKIAEKIAVYQKSQVITNKDIVLALKKQALDNYHIWDQDTTKQQLNEISQEIYFDLMESQNNPDKDSSCSDDDVDLDKQDNLQENDISQKIENIKTEITEEFLNELKTIESRWNSWTPIDNEQIILKNAINKTAKQFN